MLRLEDRFFTKVHKNEGCWNWSGATMPNGYGLIRSAGGRGGNTTLAHRVSYEIHSGSKIPNGLYVLHRCDNRRCVNPEHLFLGTQKDNIRDMIAKGRGVRPPTTHCKNGHLRTPENTMIKAETNHKNCLVCYRATTAKHSKRRRKAASNF